MSEENNNPTPFAEIEMGPSKFEVFMDQHQKKLIGLAILLLFGVLALVTQQTLKQQEREDAGSATLTAAEPEDLEKVISTYQNTDSATTATLLLANKKAEENPAQSIEDLKAFVAANDEHPAYPTALTSLGQRQLEAGDVEQAKATLLEVTQLDDTANHIKPVAYVTLGDIEKQNGNTEAAKAHYEQAKTYQLELQFGVNLGDIKLTTLGVDPPKAVDPKPPEQPAETAPGALPISPIPVTNPEQIAKPPVQVPAE